MAENKSDERSAGVNKNSQELSRKDNKFLCIAKGNHTVCSCEKPISPYTYFYPLLI